MHMVVEALVHMQWSWCKAFCANSTFAHPCTLLQVGSDFCTGSGAGDKIHCQGRLHTCEWSVQTGVAPVLLLPCPLFALLQSSFTAEAAPSKIQMCQMWQLTKIKLWAQSRSRSVNQSLFEVHFLMHRLAFGDNCKWSKDGIFYDSQLILEPLSEIDCHQPGAMFNISPSRLCLWSARCIEVIIWFIAVHRGEIGAQIERYCSFHLVLLQTPWAVVRHCSQYVYYRLWDIMSIMMTPYCTLYRRPTFF